MGLSTAYHLSLMRPPSYPPSITVVEKDPTYRYASSTLSAGGIRQQFSLVENIKMSLYTRDFLRVAGDTLGADVQFREAGYLFLARSAAGRRILTKNHRTQRDCGCEDVVLLDETEIGQQFPWLSSSSPANDDGEIFASFGAKGEGWFDPWAVMKGMKQKCLENGVQFCHGEVVSARRDDDHGGGKNVRSVTVRTSENDVLNFSVDKVVNAAGPHASTVLNMLGGGKTSDGYKLPVVPRKRCIYFIHALPEDGAEAEAITAPLTIDAGTNVYFRSEGPPHHFICGAPPAKEYDCWECYGSDSDYSSLHNPEPDFTETIWPQLYQMAPSLFHTVKVKSHWCGLYDYNVADQNAIIGYHPELENVMLINGFSGHGLQHGPAAGLAVAELLDLGRFETMDLRRMGFERFLKGGDALLFEDGIV